MANPRVKDGHIRIANDLWKAWMRIGPLKERVFKAVIWECWGYENRRNSKEPVQITRNTFAELTGIKDKALISRLTNELADEKIIIKQSGKALETPSYWPNQDYESWQLVTVPSDESVTSVESVPSDDITPVTRDQLVTVPRDESVTITRDQSVTPSLLQTCVQTEVQTEVQTSHNTNSINLDMGRSPDEDEIFDLFEDYWGLGRVNPNHQRQLRDTIKAYGSEIVLRAMRKSVVTRPKNFWAWLASVCDSMQNEPQKTAKDESEQRDPNYYIRDAADVIRDDMRIVDLPPECEPVLDSEQEEFARQLEERGIARMREVEKQREFEG